MPRRKPLHGDTTTVTRTKRGDLDIEYDPTNELAEMPSDTTVAAYFRARLREGFPDEHGLASRRDFTISTPCGRSCAQAIDAAARVLAHSFAAAGPNPRVVESVVHITAQTVRIYIYG